MRNPRPGVRAGIGLHTLASLGPGTRVLKGRLRLRPGGQVDSLLPSIGMSDDELGVGIPGQAPCWAGRTPPPPPSSAPSVKRELKYQQSGRGDKGFGVLCHRASSAASCVVTMVTKASGPSQWPRPVECGAQHRGHLPPGDGFAATQSSAFYCCPSRRPVLMFPGWGSPEVPNGPHQPRLRLCAQLPVLPENPFLAFSSFWKLPASLGGEAASSAFKGGCVAPVGPIPRLLWGLCLFCRPLVLRAAAPPSWLGRPGPHGHILSFGVKMWTSFFAGAVPSTGPSTDWLELGVLRPIPQNMGLPPKTRTVSPNREQHLCGAPGTEEGPPAAERGSAG